jgi:hypothetical protein
MSEAAATEPRKMPKGGKRGGKRFPQYPLNDAMKWSDKLVSKTHGGPQPDDLIKAGVVEAKSGVGDVRISTLKQFDLMAGTSKGYVATELAKELKSAPSDERGPLYERAALKPEIFKGLYDTFHGDSVPIAKLKQRAADLQVHPDATSKCTEVYVETMEFAGLIVRDGDLLVHTGKNAVVDAIDSALFSEYGESGKENSEIIEGDEQLNKDEKPNNIKRGVATVQVNINLDSTFDADKLQKQLELLRKFGAL